jgi:hypothetical protein
VSLQLCLLPHGKLDLVRCALLAAALVPALVPSRAPLRAATSGVDDSLLFSPSIPAINEPHRADPLPDLTLSPVLPPQLARPPGVPHPKRGLLPPSGSAFFVNTPHRTNLSRHAVVDMNGSWDKSWSEGSREEPRAALVAHPEVLNTDVRSRPLADSPNSPSFTAEEVVPLPSSMPSLSPRGASTSLPPMACLEAICAAVRDVHVSVAPQARMPPFGAASLLHEASKTLSHRGLAARRNRFSSEDAHSSTAHKRTDGECTVPLEVTHTFVAACIHFSFCHWHDVTAFRSSLWFCKKFLRWPRRTTAVQAPCTLRSQPRQAHSWIRQERLTAFHERPRLCKRSCMLCWNRKQSLKPASLSLLQAYPLHAPPAAYRVQQLSCRQYRRAAIVVIPQHTLMALQRLACMLHLNQDLNDCEWSTLLRCSVRSF